MLYIAINLIKTICYIHVIHDFMNRFQFVVFFSKIKEIGDYVNVKKKIFQAKTTYIYLVQWFPIFLANPNTVYAKTIRILVLSLLPCAFVHYLDGKFIYLLNVFFFKTLLKQFYKLQFTVNYFTYIFKEIDMNPSISKNCNYDFVGQENSLNIVRQQIFVVYTVPWFSIYNKVSLFSLQPRNDTKM